jgi:hypothetical protein
MPVEMNTNDLLDRLAIRELVDNWLVYRDAQDWEKFLGVWHEGGFTMTTWGGKATPQEFVEAATSGFERGDRMLHSVGGTTVELAGSRAISQSKFRIMQRGPIDGVLCDVTCLGRNYDFFEKRDGRWGLVVRQPIYERDSVVPVDPNDVVTFDAQRLARYPEGYARLAYLQEGLGYPIKVDMPTLQGPEVEALAAAGAQWLAGGELAWPQT